MVNNQLTNEGNIGDMGLLPGLGRSPREGNGHLLKYSYLESSMDRGTWCPPRDLPDPGIEPSSPALQADSLPSEPSKKVFPHNIHTHEVYIM